MAHLYPSLFVLPSPTTRQLSTMLHLQDIPIMIQTNEFLSLSALQKGLLHYKNKLIRYFIL
jgi:hypothetical protein